MVIKSEKTKESDPMSHAVFKALETAEILLVSEYSYEISFGRKYKA